MSAKLCLGGLAVMAVWWGCAGGNDDKAKDAEEAADDGRVAGGDASDVSGQVCSPGDKRCMDAGVESCRADGSGWDPAGTCSDGNPCTQDTCESGQCGFPPLSCDDSDACTFDYCLPWAGECAHRPLAGAKGCCSTPEDCDDGVDVTEDLCDVAGGSCVNTVETLSARLMHRFGSKGTGEGQLSSPKGLAVLSDGRVLVADSGNNRALILSGAGEQLGELLEAGGTALKAPGCAAQSSDGRIFLCDTGNDRILLLAPDGSVSAIWPPADSGVKLFHGPTDVAVDSAGNAYVTDGPGEEFDSGNSIMKLNEKGQVTAIAGKSGEGDGNFDKPSGVAVSPTGTLFITDQGNNRVQVLDGSLAFVAKFGEEGADPGLFKGPSDIAMLPDGRFFVADVGNQRVQLFESCQPDCTGKVCGSDGCLGTCGECPSFAECNPQGLCDGWVGEGGEGCNKQEAGGCAACACEKCVCTGQGALDPSLFYEGADSDPYCCETQWDEVCMGECQFVCGYSCPLPAEWPVLDPTFGSIGEWKQAGDAAMAAPLKLAVDSSGFVYVLDNVKSEVLIFEVSKP